MVYKPFGNLNSPSIAAALAYNRGSVTINVINGVSNNPSIHISM